MEIRVKEAIAAAESQGNFLDGTAFLAIKSYFEQGIAHIEAAEYLIDNAQRLIDSATLVSQKLPYSFSDLDYRREVERRQQGIKLCLRLVQYCVIAGDISPIEQYIADSGRIKHYFKLSPNQLGEALRHIKDQIGSDSNQNVRVVTEITSFLNSVIDIVLLELDSTSASKGAVVLTSKSKGDQKGWNGFDIPFWQRIANIGAQVPQEAWESLPKDMSRNGEHYLYGTLKEE